MKCRRLHEIIAVFIVRIPVNVPSTERLVRQSSIGAGSQAWNSISDVSGIHENSGRCDPPESLASSDTVDYGPTSAQPAR